MPYVYSTSARSLRIIDKGFDIVIQGGAGVTNRHLWTPKGVVTKVTDDELEFLRKHKSFLKGMENGRFSYTAKEEKVSRVTKNMADPKDDKSSQARPEEFDGIKDNSTGEKKAPVKKGD